jgi:TRAP transporter 4TM/12TM fusion protein
MDELRSSKRRSDGVVDSLLFGDKLPIPTPVVLLLAAFTVGAAIYHLFVALYGTPEALTHRTTHVTIFLILAFIFYPLKRGSWRDRPNAFSLIDLVLILLTLATYVFASRDIDAYALRSSSPEFWDTLNGTILIILILEAVRRTVGLVLVFVPLFFFLHTIFSDHFFSFFYAAPTSYRSLVAYLTMELDGIFGVPVAVASTFIIMFMIFGAVLVRSGAGTFFTDLAFSFTGQTPGGPAKAAVFSSALYGTLSGSTTANVVTTGSFTIPLMKSAGFRPKFAASVEAIASNGGQIMPPVMGAAAFIMPFYILGSSYRDVCLSSAIPAMLYYFSLYLMVHFEARKMGLKGMAKESLPKLGPTFRHGWPLAFSLAVIIGLLIYGFTPMTAGVWATLITFMVTLFRRQTRLSPGDFFAALEAGLKNAIPIVMACAAAGIIIGSMNLSGLAVRISSLVTVFSHGNLWIALLITMIVAVLLGMGVTTTIIYITLAVMVVPSLEKMSVVPMAANLFVFYFGALSGVTPPVALTTYAAAGIANSNPWRTGWESVRIGLASFIIPYMFVYTPELLLIGSWSYILICISTAVLGVFSLAVSIQGFWFKRIAYWERGFLGCAAFFFVHPNPTLGLLGLGAILAVFVRQIRGRKSLGKIGGKASWENS